MKRPILFALILSIFAFLINIHQLITTEVKSGDEKDAFDAGLLLNIIGGQLDDLRKGDIQQAYMQATSSGFRKITSFEKFTDFVKAFPVLYENKSFQLNIINFDQPILTLEGALISQHGESLEVEYDLINEQGKWKIHGIQLFKPEATVLRYN